MHSLRMVRRPNTIKLPKDGGLSECGNWRGITIVHKRLNKLDLDLAGCVQIISTSCESVSSSHRYICSSLISYRILTGYDLANIEQLWNTQQTSEHYKNTLEQSEMQNNACREAWRMVHRSIWRFYFCFYLFLPGQRKKQILIQTAFSRALHSA